MWLWAGLEKGPGDRWQGFGIPSGRGSVCHYRSRCSCPRSMDQDQHRVFTRTCHCWARFAKLPSALPLSVSVCACAQTHTHTLKCTHSRAAFCKVDTEAALGSQTWDHGPCSHGFGVISCPADYCIRPNGGNTLPSAPPLSSPWDIKSGPSAVIFM